MIATIDNVYVITTNVTLRYFVQTLCVIEQAIDGITLAANSCKSTPDRLATCGESTDITRSGVVQASLGKTPKEEAGVACLED